MPTGVLRGLRWWFGRRHDHSHLGPRVRARVADNVRMRQVARALLVTVGGLLLVPYAINVQTGGVPPAWLRPYAAALWPAALLCVAALAALEIAARRRVLLPLIPSRQDTRNVARAREHIIAYVGERRRGLLAARIALTLQERPDAVRAPVNLVQRDSDGEDVRIDASFRMADLFRSMDGSLLILGAPGAGKTTMLLDLAAELVEDDDGALPVVIDLAGWGRPRPRRFADWLFASLAERYRIPPSVGRAWLHADRLTLLLDGLDELEVGRREQCVTEIDELQADYGVTRVVVCSRVADYDRLTARLRAQGAVLIRPLTRQQVESFLGDRGLTDLLQDDAELWEVLTPPLMLTAVLAAQDDQRWRLMLAGRYRPKSLISADAEWIRRHL